MSVSAAEIPDKSFLQTVGDRRSIRYYDPDKKVEDWKIQTILQTARFASCQGNINATEAIVVQKETCDIWDEIEECVSGFNVQMINQCSHMIFWLTNLNAWYGRANDGLSSLALSGALTKYHGWNYEFTMTQTVPRLMSFPTERTEILLRYETGQAVGNAQLACLGARARQLPPRLRPQAGRRREGVRPHAEPQVHLGQRHRLPARGPQGRRPAAPPQVRQALPQGQVRRAAGVRPRRPTEALKAKGLIQEQAPLPGRIEEIDKLAAQFSRDPGVVSWPEKEVRRLINDDDWDFGPNIKKRAEEVLAAGRPPGLPRGDARDVQEAHGGAQHRREQVPVVAPSACAQARAAPVLPRGGGGRFASTARRVGRCAMSAAPANTARRAEGPRGSPTLESAARRAIAEARALLDRAEERLDRRRRRRELPGGPLPPAGEEASYRRWWSLLADVEARGGRMSADEFRELAQRHDYDPRGVGGFFSGPNSTMSREGDTVELTPRGPARGAVLGADVPRRRRRGARERRRRRGRRLRRAGRAARSGRWRRAGPRSP